MPADLRDSNRPLNGETILLVEDDRSVLKVSQKMLTRLGYKVITKTSGLAALETFRADPSRYDLIITDEALPGLKGTALAREMIRIRPGIPIIHYSGRPEILSPEMISWPGFKARIIKPVRFSVLAETVRKVLEQNKEDRPKT
jgi:DNA-binding NtrC family response regulator